MSGFDAYRTYLAVSRHFTGKYDYFKYNGKINVSEASYEARKDKYFFEKASRKFKRDEFVKFIVANSSQSDSWIGDLMTPSKEIAYKKWKKWVESLTYNFQLEIGKLNEIEEDFNNLFACKDGKHPLLFRLYLRKKVSIETIILLDDLINFSRVWERVDDKMISDFLFLISKYRPFLHSYSKLPREKLRQIILEIYS